MSRYEFGGLIFNIIASILVFLFLSGILYIFKGHNKTNECVQQTSVKYMECTIDHSDKDCYSKVIKNYCKG